VYRFRNIWYGIRINDREATMAGDGRKGTACNRIAATPHHENVAVRLMPVAGAAAGAA
jgi:hypothetical protein